MEEAKAFIMDTSTNDCESMAEISEYKAKKNDRAYLDTLLNEDQVIQIKTKYKKGDKVLVFTDFYQEGPRLKEAIIIGIRSIELYSGYSINHNLEIKYDLSFIKDGKEEGRIDYFKEGVIFASKEEFAETILIYI